MKRNGTLMIAAVLMLVIASRGAQKSGAQETPKNPVEPAAPALDERVVALEQAVAEQKAQIERLTRLADGIVAGAARLQDAANLSRTHGFEAAGPNPGARTDLIDGLKGFSETVKAASAPPNANAAKNAPPAKQH